MDATPPDAELLQAWRDSDHDAGNELVRRHFMSVYRFFVNKVGGADEVDDLLQRTFLACVEGRDRVRDDASLRGYILGIARNQMLMYVRRRQRDRQRMAPGEVSVAEISGSPSQVMAGRDEQKLLLMALREIPLDLQTVVELYYWEELSVAQMAEVLEIPAGTVKSRLFRARDALRQQLEQMNAPDDIRKTTVDGFEHWARSLRAVLEREPSQEI
ncbi:MAG: sigma-70 family RNA polymerase sigma factor [Deltaproteobacteria bacterium]|nr:sigma-70 family RNA polymerase sigma factor [Deltaproteobacteria bacterium]